MQLFIVYGPRKMLDPEYETPVVETLEVTEGAKVYTVVGGNQRAIGYRTRLHKTEVSNGRSLAFTPECAIQAYVARCEADLEDAKADVERRYRRLSAARILAEQNGVKL